MYNLASLLESVFSQLDENRRDELLVIMKKALPMNSLNTSGAWNKTGKSNKGGGSKGRDLSSIPEDDLRVLDDDADDSEDFGIFADDVVTTALEGMGYEVSYVAFGVRSLPSHVPPH
jgi:hypothetical protein